MKWLNHFRAAEAEIAKTPIDAVDEALAEARTSSFIEQSRLALTSFSDLEDELRAARHSVEIWTGRLKKSAEGSVLAQQAQSEVKEAETERDSLTAVIEKLRPSVESLKAKLEEYNIHLDKLAVESIAAQVSVIGGNVRSSIAQEMSNPDTPLNQAMATLREAALAAEAEAKAREELAGS